MMLIPAAHQASWTGARRGPALTSQAALNLLTGAALTLQLFTGAALALPSPLSLLTGAALRYRAPDG